MVMRDHEVVVDGAGGIAYAPVFNVAVAFVDRHLAQGRAAQAAIRTSTGETVSYADLAERVNRAGNVLRGLGLARGDRVVMVLEDCPAFFYLFFGAIKAGIVPVPVNTLLRAPDYAYIVADSGCRLVVYSPAFAAEVEPAVAGVPGTQARPLPGAGAGETFERLLAQASTELTPAPAAALDDCFWLYSSGSTGRPKGAVHRHRDLVVTSQRYGVETLGVRPDDCCFSAAKLFFAYGLGNALSFPLWVGASCVLDAARPTPASTFAVIERLRPSLYFGVPTLYAAQLNHLESHSADLSSLRLCVSAGEALPAEILSRWHAHTGLEILDGIGSTEALHIFISNRPGDIRPGASGRPVPGYELRIVDDAGAQVTDGEPGHLLVRGESSAVRYWNQPERSAATMVGEWLHTGDVYYRDADGYYHYCGRNDDMLKVGGIWCSPVEIEACLIEDPRVLEAAVVGREDADGLVKPAAWVVVKDGVACDDALREALAAHCKAGLARYKYPRWVEFIDELPKTPTGKIQRFKLRA